MRQSGFSGIAVRHWCPGKHSGGAMLTRQSVVDASDFIDV